MNLRELQYLVALADHRNFRRAAEACLVSQPTLSTQIRKLEEELGVALFERAPRRVMLTPAGQDAVARARRILAEMEGMREAARRLSRPEAGTARLGVFPTIGPYLLPEVMPQVRARFPQLQLLLTEEKSDQLLTRLREGRLDAAILAMPVHDPALHGEPLFKEPFLLAVPRQHALATRKSLRMEELSRYSLMLLEDGHCLRDQALEVCQLSGAQEGSEFRATSLETLRQMVLAGLGVTLMPALAARGMAPYADRLHLLRFEDSQPSRQIGLFWRRTSAMGPLLSRLAEVLRSVPPGLLDPEGEDEAGSRAALPAAE
ncbi:LysR family transcriptional regulator [Roseomonas sp. SSH11]|uniref:LysR family transcriptional regulator n=1 Tax=Pararoseomonas baculiformis TaxID=2820812 RepID=A0ABS4AJ64_9PROT|nr:LysR substrate-binding domain-containing protein [Pararoseomonas baculiformis]MBP0447074.1 LysR family transcriptional regulator [Pararoseomonas baculiformis]